MDRAELRQSSEFLITGMQSPTLQPPLSPHPTSGKLLPPTSLSIQRLFPFFFARVLHPMIQRGAELTRPGFLERFVLNCPFCRFNDLAVSHPISQVPVVSVAGLAGAAAIRSLWGRVVQEFPPAGIGCVLCPQSSMESVFLSCSLVIIPSSSCCFIVSGSRRHPSVSASG